MSALTIDDTTYMLVDPAALARIEAFMIGAGRRLRFMAVGTSGLVEPAASLVDGARQVGGTSWLVNAEAPANVDRFDHVVLGSAGAVLPPLLAG